MYGEGLPFRTQAIAQRVLESSDYRHENSIAEELGESRGQLTKGVSIDKRT